MKSGTRDEVEGEWHKMKGKINEVAGLLNDNNYLEAENKTGLPQETAGFLPRVDLTGDNHVQENSETRYHG